jgi:hypothetical protein
MLKKVPLSGATYNNDLLNYQGFILNSLLHLSMTFQVPPKMIFGRIKTCHLQSTAKMSGKIEKKRFSRQECLSKGIQEEDT